MRQIGMLRHENEAEPQLVLVMQAADQTHQTVHPLSEGPWLGQRLSALYMLGRNFPFAPHIPAMMFHPWDG